MSAGAFTNTRYSTDGGVNHPIRVQPETLALTINSVANAAPSGTVAAGVPSAKVSGSSRSIGVNARKVRLEFTGSVPDGYEPGNVLAVPWLNGTTFGAISKGQTGTYLTVPVRVVGKTPERIN